MIKLLFILSDSMNTTSQATAVEESGLLTDDVLEKEVTDLITSIYTGTLNSLTMN
jgi:hypothetical protein